MALVAPARHVKMRLKIQATKIDGFMKTQKTSITKTVKTCLEIILQFKSNQKIANSLLIKQNTNEFNTAYTKLIGTLTELEQSMQEYMKLSVIASSENMSKGVLEQKIMGQTAQMTYYSNMVENVKKGNKTVFKDIYSVLGVSQKTKQPVSNEQLCKFKPNTNLRPAPLTFQSSI